MCGSSPPAPEPAPPPPPPPPPAAAEPISPVISEAGGKRKSQSDQANAKRSGTRAFRNDLSIPAGASSGGAGLNIPG